GRLDVLALQSANGAVATESFELIFQSQEGSPGAASEGVSQHLVSVAKNESGALPNGFGKMFQLHPALAAPAEEFYFVRLQVLRPNHGCGAVVFFQALVDHQVAIAEVLSHRRSRIRRGMLDIGPIDMPAREFQVGIYGFASVVGIAHDQSSYH